ncbi:hypothetical protein PQJ75_25320 [Rhodoplanes sp. TEM]|uniref:Uncharacterized protein n=1 Tax=Rhodoplanes tepidamans TaxID=200616 RepID=A0ABT5JIW5_RHOTP|nr:MULTISPECIES: hypothetical protein [Rhodoplanes]MDC7789660.1 hypothetical protein [Rhodoplanes tepidamans]MDC7987065.1 hypothetical protein [Rhodoplanes sp. TEM]MDQ0353596.1 hypothetical protein [Rhodoplanes tepidamans]
MTSAIETPPTLTVEGEEDLVAIRFDAVAAYHGQAALAMLAVTFQALRVMLPALSPQRPPRRADLSVLSGHPGPGVRDAFEFVTRAVTRGAYTVDRTLPEARLCPGLDVSYSWRVSMDGRTVGAALRAGVLPDRFFDLVARGAGKNDAERSEFSALKRRIAGDVLAAAPDTLFERL